MVELNEDLSYEEYPVVYVEAVLLIPPVIIGLSEIYWGRCVCGSSAPTTASKCIGLREPKDY